MIFSLTQIVEKGNLLESLGATPEEVDTMVRVFMLHETMESEFEDWGVAHFEAMIAELKAKISSMSDEEVKASEVRIKDLNKALKWIDKKGADSQGQIYRDYFAEYFAALYVKMLPQDKRDMVYSGLQKLSAYESDLVTRKMAIYEAATLDETNPFKRFAENKIAIDALNAKLNDPKTTPVQKAEILPQLIQLYRGIFDKQDAYFGQTPVFGWFFRWLEAVQTGNKDLAKKIVMDKYNEYFIEENMGKAEKVLTDDERDELLAVAEAGDPLAIQQAAADYMRAWTTTLYILITDYPESDISAASQGATAGVEAIKNAMKVTKDNSMPRLASDLLPGDSASAFYKDLARELTSSDKPLTQQEVLDLLTRKILTLGGEAKDLVGTLQYLVEHLKNDNRGDLGKYPGLEQLDSNEIYRYFSERAEALYEVLTQLGIEKDEAIVLLGSDAEHLMPALQLLQNREVGHFSLNRSRLMSEQEYKALKGSEQQVIGKTGYTTKTQTKIPGFEKEFVWQDNSLVNSTLFQIARFAMHTDRYPGKNFEERFAAGLRDELNNKTLQKERTGLMKKATLFGTPTKESEAAIKAEINNDGFSTRSMALFQEFYEQHLRANTTVRIPDVGTTGLQPLMLYGTLEYLKTLAGNESDPNFLRLTPQQQQMARDIKASDKKIKISLMGLALDKVWANVPMGQDMRIVPAQNSLFDVLERFHSLESSRDLKAVPSKPMDQALSYFVSLVTRNVFLEKQSRSELRTGVPVAASTVVAPSGRPVVPGRASPELQAGDWVDGMIARLIDGGLTPYAANEFGLVLRKVVKVEELSERQKQELVDVFQKLLELYPDSLDVVKG
ncbi:MAG: hypothetical protein WCJ71_10445, partial [Candidatus Omnitrophota bacterium]